MPNEYQKSIAKQLELLDTPVIRDKNETGKVYNVVEIDIIQCSLEYCKEHNIIPEEELHSLLDKKKIDTCLEYFATLNNNNEIPIIVIKVKSGDEEKMYRLHSDYLDWAYSGRLIYIVSKAVDKEDKVLPHDIEFGILNGKRYAEFVFTDEEKDKLKLYTVKDDDELPVLVRKFLRNDFYSGISKENVLKGGVKDGKKQKK